MKQRGVLVRLVRIMKKLNQKTSLKQKLSLKNNSNLLSISLILSAFLVSGCQNKTTSYESTVIPIPMISNSLKVKCESIKEIPSTKEKDVATWISNEVIQHSECIDKHNALVDAVNLLYKE